MSGEQLFEEVGKRLGKQPEEVRAALRDTVGILDCIAEMRENQHLDCISTLITVGIRGTARALEQLTQ